jgi:hypothetical protein
MAVARAKGFLALDLEARTYSGLPSGKKKNEATIVAPFQFSTGLLVSTNGSGDDPTG